MDRLQYVQSSAAGVLTQNPWKLISPTLIQLNWLQVKSHIIYKILLPFPVSVWPAPHLYTIPETTALRYGSVRHPPHQRENRWWKIPLRYGDLQCPISGHVKTNLLTLNCSQRLLTDRFKISSKLYYHYSMFLDVFKFSFANLSEKKRCCVCNKQSVYLLLLLLFCTLVSTG